MRESLYLTLILQLVFVPAVTYTGRAQGLPDTSRRPAASTPQPIAPAADLARVSRAYGNLPMSFEANHGQASGPAAFIARGYGCVLFLEPAGAVLSIAQSDRNERTVVRMALAGANATPQIASEDELPGKVNYLIGNDPSHWRSGISTFAKVRYTAVYPGIDLIYYGNQRQLEYDFVLAPGADVAMIRMTFEGIRRTVIAGNGDLVLDAGGDVRFRKPLAYQEENGRRVDVPSRYVLLDEHTVGFELDGYDRGMPLIIDPVLEYSTFIGSGAPEGVTALAVDAAANIYVVGNTLTMGLFTEDVVVSKLNADGSLIYTTYFGGSGPDWNSGRDFGVGIAVGASGTVYVTGNTSSTNFPVVNALQPVHAGGSVDAFISRLNASGTGFVYSTYLGGSGPDQGHDIALDDAGRMHVVGWTRSMDFPTTNAFQPALNGIERDAFVAKLTPDGSALLYSTYLGGDRVEDPSAIAVDLLGSSYVTGATASQDFPMLNAIQPTFGGSGEDAFVSKFDAAGGLVYSTFLGGNSLDFSSDIAIGTDGSAYVIGSTRSTDFPLVNPLKSELVNEDWDGFVSKLNPAGSALSYSTYLGGSANEGGQGIAVDEAGSAYVTGGTSSADFPTVAAFQPSIGNVTGTIFDDIFVAKLFPAGNGFEYSSFLGGSEGDNAGGIALDEAGSVYVAGSTRSAYFPTANAMQPDMQGKLDGFIAKISDVPNPAITGISPALGSPGTIVDTVITGMNFVEGATTVSVSGTGVSVGTVTVTSPASLTTSLTIDDDAALDAHSVTVETPNGVSARMMFMVYSATGGCNVSLPVKLNGAVGSLDVTFGIGTSEPTSGNWILGLITHDGSTTTIYGVALYAAELPAINPPITNWTNLPAEIEGKPVVGVINGYFNPDLCAHNLAIAP